MRSYWWVEIWRLLASLAGGALVGAAFGHALWGLGLGGCLLLGWHAYQLYVFERWLRKGSKRSKIPELSGAWDALIQHVYQIKKRSRARKSRLRRMLARFNASTTAHPDAVVVIARHGEIEWANRAAVTLLGIRPRDVGQRVLNLLRDPAFHDFYAGAADDTDEARELELASPVDERRLLNVRIVPFGDRNRLLTARDMSEQARVRQMRRDFVANVSHELRTPLTVIAGYLETFADEDGLPPHLDAQLATLTYQAQRMNRLVEDLLTLARLENSPLPAADCKPVRVGAIVAGLIEDARRMAEFSGHRLVVECAPDLALRGRETELTSVFSNLINNALQHTPGGTEVSVRWQATAGGGARFEVADDGPGIDAEHIERLTERFYRVDAGRSRERGGTGLGLSIVKHVLQRHGTSLGIVSTPGRGSRFYCDFPPEQTLRRAAQSPAAVESA